MFAARLLVQRGSVDSKTQDWGEFSFAAAPSPGDRIAAENEGVINYLTVLSVHHKPVRVQADGPPPAGASADVVAIWTGSD